MSDLISRSALFEKMTEEYKKYYAGTGTGYDFTIAMNMVQQQPTIEAAPVDRNKIIDEFAKRCKEHILCKHALSELTPYIAPYVFYSLVDNLSYEDICAKNYLYIGKGDFYGHRRRGIAAIKRWMILYNVWEFE